MRMAPLFVGVNLRVDPDSTIAGARTNTRIDSIRSWKARYSVEPGSLLRTQTFERTGRAVRFSHYPLIPEATLLAIKYRWKMTKKIAIGTVVITAIAISTG